MTHSLFLIKKNRREKKITHEEYILDQDRYDHVSKGLIIAKDKDNNTLAVTKDDPRWKSGELVGATANTVPVVIDGVLCRIPSNDERIISGKLKPVALNNHIRAINVKTGESILVDSDDPRWKTGEIHGIALGRIRIIKDGVIKTVEKDRLDSFLSDGWEKLTKENTITPIPTTSGLIRIHKYDENGIINRTLIPPDKFEDYQKEGWSRGQGKVKPRKKSTKPPKPRQKGINTIVSLPDGSKIKQIRKEELDNYISNGWIKGVPRDKNPATGKIHIHLENSEGESTDHKMILKEDLEKYEKQGWKLGLGKRK